LIRGPVPWRIRHGIGPVGFDICIMRRPERVAELLHQEISEIVGFELDDPRMLAVTVTEVKVASDLRDAKVFVLVDGDEKEISAALTALRHAAPYVRRQVGTALNLRHTPALHFVRDTVEERGSRVDQLLAEIQRESFDRKDEE
jgi:ribosome-binding factor A